MHLEKDFTGDIKRAEVMEHQENKKRDGEKLDELFKYYYLKEKQYKRVSSEHKRKNFFELYRYLERLAFSNSGRVSLDVNEESLKATITYWSAFLFFTEESNDIFGNDFLTAMKGYSLVCIEPMDEGIQITIHGNLYDEIKA